MEDWEKRPLFNAATLGSGACRCSPPPFDAHLESRRSHHMATSLQSWGIPWYIPQNGHMENDDEA